MKRSTSVSLLLCALAAMPLALQGQTRGRGGGGQPCRAADAIRSAGVRQAEAGREPR